MDDKDLSLIYKFTDRGGNAVYDVYPGTRMWHKLEDRLGEIRLAPDAIEKDLQEEAK